MNPAFTTAVAREDQLTLLAHLPYAPPLLGVTIVPLAWRHVLELTLRRNAFFAGLAPLKGDVAELLWHLHPYFRTGDGRFPNLPPGARRPTRLGVWLTRRAVAQHCAKIDLVEAERVIRTWKDEQFMDAPQGRTEKQILAASSPLAARVDQVDAVASILVFRAGYSRDAVLASGVAWTLQILRAEGISNGEQNRYIRPSAELIGDPAP